MPTYKNLTAKHPDYDAKQWATLRALYEGGRKLTRNDAVMKEIFPQHGGERADTYAERRARAFYMPYLGQIIDFLLAGLATDPASFEEPESETEFYSEFRSSTAKPTEGAAAVSFSEFLRGRVLDALMFRHAWALAELPPKGKDAAGDEVEYPHAAAEEAAGARRAYLCAVPPEQVLDWEENDDGALTFANVRTITRRRKDVDGDRDTVREEFTWYTPTDWRRYACEYKVGNVPADSFDVPLVDKGTHSFGRVPLRRMTLSAALHAAGKIEGAAIEHFNRRCALSWGAYKSLFQTLVYNLADANVKTGGGGLDSITNDPNRSDVPIGPGRRVVLGENDKVGYFGADSAPFTESRADLAELRDEMHRVLWAMAQSVDNSGAALKRSGESKKVDSTITSILLRALGVEARKFGGELLDAVAKGRGDDIDADDWNVTGFEEFDDVDVGALIDEAASVDLLDMPSPTFLRLYKTKLALRLVGDDANDEDRDAIRDELEQAYAHVGPIDMPGKHNPPPELHPDPAGGGPVPRKAPARAPKAPKGKAPAKARPGA